METIPAELKPIGSRLKPLIDAGLPKAACTIWHGQPVWMIEKKPVAMLKAYPKYITFALFSGQNVSDASGRLEAGAQKMASVKLKEPGEIDAPVFAEWLRQAQALEA
jgi:hypothetical protein